MRGAAAENKGQRYCAHTASMRIETEVPAEAVTELGAA
jgi:hypothetical protein